MTELPEEYLYSLPSLPTNPESRKKKKKKKVFETLVEDEDGNQFIVVLGLSEKARYSGSESFFLFSFSFLAIYLRHSLTHSHSFFFFFLFFLSFFTSRTFTMLLAYPYRSSDRDTPMLLFARRFSLLISLMAHMCFFAMLL